MIRNKIFAAARDAIGSEEPMAAGGRQIPEHFNH